MFGDIFATEEELLSGEAGGQIQNSWERLPRNCADKLPMPELPRKKGYPIGLKNQGATCYLNSLFQLLFHSPELRDIILQLPLCKDNSSTPSDFVSQNKHNFLLGFQRLFSEMSLCDKRAVGTEYLQKSFGWENEQHLEQQDIQQAMRVIFDTIERALFGTVYHQSIRQLFRGVNIRYKTCTVCSEASERAEQFYDLLLQVKFIKNVPEALQALTTPESMNGDNAIFCDACECKQDMLLGTRLQDLPGTLVLTLNRFDFDYQKMDRVKLNSYFEFQLQLDLSPFVMPTPDPDYNRYQLYGVVIHRGSAHGGHYLCFARDLLHETEWKKGLQEAKAQQARIKEGIKAGAEEKKQEKKLEKQEKKQVQNEDKEYDLKEPLNKKLLEGWYQINDNVTTAIDAKKITSKFEGSDSAYILFYRRKSLPVSQTKPKVPSYFADPIIEANKAVLQEREAYQIQKQHIVLNIEGEDHRLKSSMSLSDFKSTFIPVGSSLVLESSHNGLPYYPLQIVNHPDIECKPEQNLITLEVPHESKWKKYMLNSPEYEQIRTAIGKNRLPMELVIIIDGQTPKRIVAYSDENFIMLRLKIEKTIKVPYQRQIITLATSYKQTVLTENSLNDDMLLSKLGVSHGAQLQIKSQANEEEEDGMKEESKKEDSLLICFVIERDDEIGLKRFYFEKTKTLDELLQYFLSMEALFDEKKRRFRNLNGNRLFYTDHYPKTLQELELNEEMVRLRLERGEVPIKGDILVKIKMQSTLVKKEGEDVVANIQRIFDPNIIIKDVKEWACQHYHLDSALHKLYLTDWVGEPVRSLNREHLTVFEANFGREETVCLRDIYSPIGAELVHLEVFTTLTGAPDSTQKEGIHVKIQQFKTVKDLKDLLITTFELKDITPPLLRLREIKRDYMFGSVWRDESKTVKSVTINSNKIVYQVLEQPEDLTDDQIVVILKKRNKEKRNYEGSMELVFHAGKTPSVEELAEAVKAIANVQEDIVVTKYLHYNFEWIELSRKTIEELAKQKKKPQQKKKGEQKGQQKGQQKGKKQEEGKPEGEKKEKKQGKKEKKKQEHPNQQETTEASKQVKQGKPEEERAGEKKQFQQKKGQQKEHKGKKEKKGGKGEQHQKDLLEECQNLRKAPVLLKDGDLLGWGPASDLEGDDFQTDEDLAWRVQLKKETAKYKGKEKGGFKLGVDF